jgi:regulatory protein
VGSAYLDALKMLARRELSEAQIRQRLARREHDAGEIDAAVERLRSERAIDDRRVAEAIARTQSSLKRRGKLRIRREIEHAGIARETARAAVDDVLADVDGDVLLEQALAKRKRGGGTITDQKEFNRLYRYLVNQGFEVDRVLAALRKYNKSDDLD